MVRMKGWLFLKKGICSLLVLALLLTSFGALAEGVSEDNSGIAPVTEDTNAGPDDDQILAPVQEQNDASGCIGQVCRLLSNGEVAYVTTKKPADVYLDINNKEKTAYHLNCEGTILAVTEYLPRSDGKWFKVWYISPEIGTIQKGYISVDVIEDEVYQYEDVQYLAGSSKAVAVKSTTDAKLLFVPDLEEPQVESESQTTSIKKRSGAKLRSTGTSIPAATANGDSVYNDGTVLDASGVLRENQVSGKAHEVRFDSNRRQALHFSYVTAYKYCLVASNGALYNPDTGSMISSTNRQLYDAIEIGQGDYTVLKTRRCSGTSSDVLAFCIDYNGQQLWVSASETSPATRGISIATGQPNAEVELLNYQDEVVATGTTDASGNITFDINDYVFDLQAAIDFAEKHWTDPEIVDHNDCATFVSHIISAGGICEYCPNTQMNGGGSLASGLKNKLINDGIPVITNPDLNTIRPGDIIWMHEMGHVMFVTEVREDAIHVYAHSTSYKDQTLSDDCWITTQVDAVAPLSRYVYRYRINDTDSAGNIKIIKKDEDTGALLQGAEFDLQDSNGNVIDHGTTNANGEILFEELEAGDYTLVETKAPTGYQ